MSIEEYDWVSSACAKLLDYLHRISVPLVLCKLFFLEEAALMRSSCRHKSRRKWLLSRILLLQVIASSLDLSDKSLESFYSDFVFSAVTS